MGVYGTCEKCGCETIDYSCINCLNDEIEDQKELLNDLGVALDDWIHMYAPEFSGEEYVVETRKRIKENGGTLAYIADLRQRIREKLNED